MVLPALVQLRRLIDEADGDSVKLAAIRDVLDRCGLKPVEKVQADNQVSIVVSYEDRGAAPRPHTVDALKSIRNGQQVLNGPEGV